MASLDKVWIVSFVLWLLKKCCFLNQTCNTSREWHKEHERNMIPQKRTNGIMRYVVGCSVMWGIFLVSENEQSLKNACTFFLQSYYTLSFVSKLCVRPFEFVVAIITISKYFRFLIVMSWHYFFLFSGNSWAYKHLTSLWAKCLVSLSDGPSWRDRVPNAMFWFEEESTFVVKTSLV